MIGFAGCMRGHNYKREGILGYPEKFYRKSTLEQFTVFAKLIFIHSVMMPTFDEMIYSFKI